MNALGVLAAVEALGGDLARAALALGQWRAPEGRGRALDGAARPRRARRRDHADRRKLQRQSGGDGGGARGLRRRAPDRRHRPGVARAGGSPSSATCWSSGRASASCTPVSPGCRRWRASPRCIAPAQRMRALYDALPGTQRGEWFPDAEAMAARARRLVDAGDIAMVKGSLGSRVGQVVEAIKTDGRGTPRGSRGGVATGCSTTWPNGRRISMSSTSSATSPSAPAAPSSPRWSTASCSAGR